VTAKQIAVRKYAVKPRCCTDPKVMERAFGDVGSGAAQRERLGNPDHPIERSDRDARLTLLRGERAGAQLWIDQVLVSADRGLNEVAPAVSDAGHWREDAPRRITGRAANEPQRFRLNPIHQMPRLNILALVGEAVCVGAACPPVSVSKETTVFSASIGPATWWRTVVHLTVVAVCDHLNTCRSGGSLQERGGYGDPRHGRRHGRTRHGANGDRQSEKEFGGEQSAAHGDLPVGSTGDYNRMAGERFLRHRPRELSIVSG
jgi:hypothetical protein